MNKLDLSVVILHYNDFSMTKAYIENLKEQNWQGISHHYIVVDNASPDGSGEKLKTIFADTPETVVLLSEDNLGFAKGNNLGIRYADANFNSDLIVVSNNDIVIEDREFMQKLVGVYLRERFALFGPDIFSIRKNVHQSPIRSCHLSCEEVQNKMVELDRTLWKLKLVEKIKVYDLLRKLKEIVGKPRPHAAHWDSVQEGVVLQGAFFVLAERYMKAYPDGLYPGTFLYMEEDILNYRAKKENLRILYDPSLSVLHLDGASTLSSAGTRCKKYIFELEQTKISCQKMLEYMSANR